MRLLAWLTGGRPMARLRFAFTDVVSGQGVYVYQDYYGRLWLAEGAWGWCRVPTEKGTWG